VYQIKVEAWQRSPAPAEGEGLTKISTPSIAGVEVTSGMEPSDDDNNDCSDLVGGDDDGHSSIDNDSDTGAIMQDIHVLDVTLDPAIDSDSGS
jgi:hypothetical protein